MHVLVVGVIRGEGDPVAACRATGHPIQTSTQDTLGDSEIDRLKRERAVLVIDQRRALLDQRR